MSSSYLLSRRRTGGDFDLVLQDPPSPPRQQRLQESASQNLDENASDLAERQGSKGRGALGDITNAFGERNGSKGRICGSPQLKRKLGPELSELKTPKSPAIARRLHEEPAQDRVQPIPSPVRAQPVPSVVDAAVQAAQEAMVSGGMESSWTSALAMKMGMLLIGRDGDDVLTVLKAHGWVGGQFSGPPDRKRLLQNLIALSKSKDAARQGVPLGLSGGA
eukprot:TRINITY_DN125943_c0_g1_i1.p2 TRINITY_DN125943_c0_g1~~TRINITY_DN125943_c0_g1_i1.p2  ORF type:complete len:220 (+),score=60.64 TRINITY_DN125943_c0_g1_i1:69-728(+)